MVSVVFGLPLQALRLTRRTDGVQLSGHTHGCRVFLIFKHTGQVRCTIVRDTRTHATTLAETSEAACTWAKDTLQAFSRVPVSA